MRNKAETHISDVRAFKTCRRKWQWASPLRHNLEPNVPYAPFFTGRAVHYALEMYYADNIPLAKSVEHFLEHERREMEKEGRLWPAEENIFAEQTSLIRGMMDHYALWVKGLEGKYSDQNLEFITLERPFEVPLYTSKGRKAPKVFLAGRFDGLLRNKVDNTFWIWETKTTRSIDELTRSLANDEQCGAYLWAAQQTYEVPVVGVLYNILRKKVPTEPQLLKNGMLSVNKSIDTTASAYFLAIRKTHPDWEMDTIMEYYGDILNHLQEGGNQFFARVPVYRTQTEISQLAKDLYHTAMEMINPKTVMYPSPSWLNCNFCHFKSPCLTLNAGGNYQFLLDNEYRQRPASVSWRLGETEDEKEGMQ